MIKPLQGVRIVDMSHVIAGPMASLYLAQLGAEVIKIESPTGGDVMRSKASKNQVDCFDTPSAFAAFNAGKNSVAVDIRQPEGADIVRSLARQADIFIENFRPGVVAKYGLGFDDIRKDNPDIVYCSISGFGQNSKWSSRGAYDHVIQALTGMMMMSGDSPDSPPAKVGFPVVDMATGMIAALSMMSALRMRDITGDAQYIDCSMTDASLMLMYPHACSFLTDGVEPERIGNRGFTGSPGANTYKCLDGWLAIAANTPAQFRKLADLLGLSGLCENDDIIDVQAFNAPGGGFVVARNEALAQEVLSSAFEKRAAAEMEVALNDVGVPAARVRSIGEYLSTEHSESNLSPHASFDQGPFRMRTPGLGFRSQDWGNEDSKKAPSLGEQTREQLTQLGLDKDRVESLFERGIVGSPIKNKETCQ
ncbi:CaiB/BaiF CoA transferase family protein [Paraburkholderia antibiotica]|uniref:CoA transferase n=1 Tax=Paraburkholderia antibiotica TaxID=2728839 RepID=A0A7X9X369_9BURK|nr:CoA transferase [Paraburkholderia antibiotica]NML30588.1 CoA transferase [Paraburkholderia antibiotica]